MKLPITIQSGGSASWSIRVAVGVVVAAVVLWVPTRGSDSLIDICTEALVLMAAALSLNLLLGYTGQISLGHSAFFGLGVYTTAVGVTRWGWSPFWTMPVAFLLAFVVGVAVSLPALRIVLAAIATMVRFGHTTSTAFGKRSSAGIRPRLQNVQAISMDMTTVLPLPVAILQP